MAGWMQNDWLIWGLIMWFSWSQQVPAQKSKCIPEIVLQILGPINENGQEGANASRNKNMLRV